MADQSHGVAIAGALIAATATIAAAFITIEPWQTDDPPPSSAPTSRQSTVPETFADFDEFFTNASAFLSRDSGPAGTSVNVSGEGFAADERVVIRFHTEQIGSTQANGAGSFSNVAVEIPASFSKFAPQQFEIIVGGESSLKSARAPFTITG